MAKRRAGERLRNDVVHGLGLEENSFAIEVVHRIANGTDERVG